MILLIFLAVVLGAGGVYILVNRWTSGEVHGLELIGAAVVTFLLILTMFASPVPVTRVIAALLLIVSFLFISLGGKVQDAVILRQMLREDLEKYRATAQQDPSNFGARIKLAKTLYKMGYLESAIEHMKAGLEMAGAFREEQSNLRMWEEELAERAGKGEVFCPHCRTKNRRGARVCRKCEAYLRSPDEVIEWLRRGGVKAILRGWLVGAVVVTMVVFALSFFSRIGIIVVASVGCIVFLLWLLVHWHMEP